MPKGAEPSKSIETAVEDRVAPGTTAASLGSHPETATRVFKMAGHRYRLVLLEDNEEAAVAELPAVDVLTARELQIVALVAEGRVNKQIADVLRISEWTVSTHLRRIFAKLHVDTRAAMVSRCWGLIASIHANR